METGREIKSAMNAQRIMLGKGRHIIDVITLHTSPVIMVEIDENGNTRGCVYYEC